MEIITNKAPFKTEETRETGLSANHTARPFSAPLSEQWLLERTYHAQLSNGSELSVPHLTEAMQQLTDVSVPLSTQSWKSLLPERLPSKKSSEFYVPVAAWVEITRAEAASSYQQGIPLLLYTEHLWKHPEGARESWRPNKNMRGIIYGKMGQELDAVAEPEYAVCYLDRKRGAFSNVTWKRWFSADPTTLFENNNQVVAFLRPYIQFPFTTHYTVVASDGHVSDYPDRDEALQGFAATPRQKEHETGGTEQAAPYFCYYHEVECPDGIYRIEFFGPHMDEPGYALTEHASAPLS
ncbi:hypothetical protein KDW_48250 [Dictyobacter vulcani]|uniref:Uncharacterized protein n=1 Tax=Dictyobacter vulcani TaxID=2607529 RepID=A0A5J4KSL5_9CHLR|nr:hypothetical protein [Dictyobacter vulcani]GER90663.1 hypothetical protein KDW_48250 [Dictyobacter vulcani]